MDLHEQGASSRTFVIAAIVCVLLQAGLAPQISIAGGRVNFMIILVCLSVFSGDPTRAVVCGFCSGLFYDLSAAVPVPQPHKTGSSNSADSSSAMVFFMLLTPIHDTVIFPPTAPAGT